METGRHLELNASQPGLPGVFKGSKRPCLEKARKDSRGWPLAYISMHTHMNAHYTCIYANMNIHIRMFRTETLEGFLCKTQRLAQQEPHKQVKLKEVNYLWHIGGGAPAVPLPYYLSQQMSLTHAAYRCKEGRTEKIMDGSDFKSLGDTENTEGLISHSSVWLHKKHTDRS